MCLQINKPISLKLVANYFPRRFWPLICAANPYTFRPRHEKEVPWGLPGRCLRLELIDALDTLDWPELTFSHEKCDDIHEFPLNFYVEESRFLYQRA